jgi:hypothetical protein
MITQNYNNESMSGQERAMRVCLAAVAVLHLLLAEGALAQTVTVPGGNYAIAGAAKDPPKPWAAASPREHGPTPRHHTGGYA